jgi:hypothetical protein
MMSCGTCSPGTSCATNTCAPCMLPDCTTIPCGYSVTVCGETIVSCASGCGN